jgi:hypothetical protein
MKAHEAGDTENAQILAAELRRLTEPPVVEEPVPQPQSGFKANVRAGIERLLGDKDAFLAGLGVEGAAESAAAHRKKAAQIAFTPEFTDQPFEFFKSVLGGSLPYMAAPLGLGLAATPLGVPAAIGASGLASAAQFTGSNLTRQLEEGTRPEDLGLGKAAATAVPQAALDVIGFRYIPGIRKIFSSAGVQIGNKEAAGIVQKYITPAFKAAGVEGGTEVGQQVLERLQAGLSIDDPEARKEYFDSFVGGAVLGGALSIPGSMLEGTGRPTALAPTSTETPAAPTSEPDALQPAGNQELLALPAPEQVPQLGYTPPTRMLPAPPEKYDVYKMMDSYETLNASLDPLAEKIEAARTAGEDDVARSLIAEYRDNDAKAKALKAKIEELGGFTESREEIEGTQAKTLKDIDSKIAKLQNTISEMSRADVRDYDAVEKAEKQLEKLKAQRAAAEESFSEKQDMLRVKETPAGEQIPMFGAEEAQPKSAEVLKFKTEKGDEFTATELEQAGQGPERPDQGVISAAAEKAVAQRENVLATRRGELDSLMLDEYNDNLANTKAREGTLKEDDRQPMDAYNRARHEERLHQATLQVRQLENEIGALKEGKTTKAVKEKLEGQFNSDELYGNFNILNTAINNNDQKTIDRIIEMRRKADRAAFNAQHSKLTPREEIYELLKDRIGGILRREKNYDTYEATINKKRVELSVSEEAAKEILRLRNIVEAPRSRTVNGKKVQVRSLLQQLHDFWDDYNAREEQLTALKKEKAPAGKIAKKKQQVEKAKEKYQKKFEEVAAYRQQLDAELAKLYKKSGEFAPVEGTKGEPTIKTPRQKQEELKKLGKSARDTSRPVKTAANIQAGKVKISEAKVAQELGETMAEYQAFAAPYQKRLQAKVDQFNKFIDTANERLAKLKETLVDANEVAAVEKQLNLAIKVRDAVPDENPIEKDKASKKVNSLKEHLKVVKTPKEDKYKLAEANLVKIAKDRRAELDALKAELTKVVGEKAVALGKKHPDFKTKFAEAKKDYQESLQDSVQEVKSLRTPQVTRKIAKLGSVRTSSEESRSASQRRQEAFEADLSEAKGEAFDYQQRQEAIERTNRKRIAKEGKGTAMEVAMTKAAQEKVIKEVEAREKEQGKFARGVEVESPDLTPEQVKMLEANNLAGVLRSIANDPKASELNRVVAARLAGILDATNVVIKDKLFDSEGKEVLGEAISTQIQLSRNGGLSQEVLLHEATHAAVERVIQMPDSMLTKEQIAAKRELKALFNAIKNDPKITSTNAKSSLSEFAAEIFSNKNLQEQLRNKKWKGSSLWEGLKSVILRMLGVKIPENMLGNALKAVDLLMIPSSSKVGRAEVLEQPRYAPKDVGVQEEKPGFFSFRSKEEPTDMASSFVGTSKSAKDTLMGNVLGLTGRVQFVDRFAALSEAFKKGKDEGLISSLEATQGEYYLRFGEQRSQYATESLTNGTMHLKKLADGKGYIYESRPGANMIKVADALSKAGIKNDTQAEAMFTAYVAGLRAEKVGWDKLNLKDPAKSKAEHAEVMAYLKQNTQARDAFVEANKIYQEYNNGLIDFLVQTGAMSEKQAAELKALPYVPYYRVRGDVVELMVDKERPVRIGNIKDEPELQQLVGSNDQIMPIFTSAVQNTFILTNMALRNQMIKDSSFLLHKLGIASSIGKSTKTVVTNKKEIEEAAKAGKVIPEKTKEVSIAPANPNIVRFKVNGEDHFALINSDDFGIPADLIVKGMEGIKTTLPFAIKAMGVPADILRKFVTRNPAYAIKQAIRDPLTAWMTTGTSGVPVLNGFKELSKMVAGRSEEERKLMASGAISSNVFTGDQRDMDKALRDVVAGKQGWTKWMARADAFAMQGDAATRAVVYKDSLAKGLSEMEALLRTLESMNFSRRGLSPSMQALSVMIPFFNAQIQGLDVLYRAFKGDMPFNDQLEIRKKLFQRGLLLAAGTMAYAAMMQDDEAYKNAKPEERLANWFVYIPGEEEPLKIPIPFELGYLFKALPEAVFNMGAEDRKSEDITKGMGKLLLQSVPLSQPQAIKPLVELYLNKSFFAGDIESQREVKTMLPTERYRETTTELAKLLGSLTGDAGITPIGWDHLTRGYTGGLGVALVSLANPILNTEAGDVAKPTKKMHEQPFIGGFFQPVEGRGTLDAGYERMLEIQQAKGTFDRLLTEGKRDQAREFLDEYRNKIAYASLSGTVQQKLGELSKLRRNIIAHPTMTEEQKTERVEKIDKVRNDYVEKFLSVTD